MTVTALTEPPARWQPTRAGLVSLWRYWDETFTFHAGRLLLRGPNGSGKSMALELLLPLVLDANTSPGRLTSAAKSRGGLYDRVMTGTSDATRTGFAWVEFTRGNRTFTAGARIRASAATRKADVDWFTTTLAVGRDLHLLDQNRTPLSRKALIEALGDAGRVHATADEHRSAVREALFPGFSADRYASVITALLALRKEKLSQHLDLAKLSETLSESLPPVDEHDVAAVAEGFERLDRRKQELLALEAEVVEVRQLADRQRHYARAVVVGSARGVRGAETRRDDVTRNERQAEAALAAVEAESAASAEERRAVAERLDAVRVEAEALKDSDAYRDGAALADLRAQAQRLRRGAAIAGERSAAQAVRREAAAGEADDAAGERQAAAANLGLARRDLQSAAEAVAGEDVVAEAAAVEEPDQSERLVRAWVDAHRSRVREVRGALDAHAGAVRHRSFVEAQVAADEAAVDDRLVRLGAARAEADAAAEAYGRAVTAWGAGCDTIGPDRATGALPRPADDPAGVAAAVAALRGELHAEDAVASRDLDAERSAALAERERLAAERERWAEGGLVDPEGPPWRSRREGRAGAPLWRLVDVAAGVDAVAVDGMEAALTGAGLIDAWVAPDGTVDLGDGRADVTVAVRPVAGATLASMLVPAGDARVRAEVVAGVLASIRLAATAGPPPAAVDGAAPTAAPRELGPDDDAGEVVVAADGTYRLGAASGRGPRRRALLLGAVARERHRLERLAAVDAAVADVDATIADLDRRRAALDRRRAAVAAEFDAVPSGAAVEECRAAVARATAHLGEAEARLRRTRADLSEAEAVVREALRALTTLAARHSLPTDAGGLAQVESGLSRLADTTAAWARRRRDLARAERDAHRAAARLGEAERDAERAAADHAEAEREATAVEGRVAGLESSVGAEYGEVLRRLAVLDAEGRAAHRRHRELLDQVPKLERRVGSLRTELTAAASAREAAERERAEAHGRLVAALDALGDDAAVGPPVSLDTASAVLAAARALVAAHESLATDDQAVERLSERVRERVHAAQAALGTRVDVARELASEGWWVVRTLAGGVRRGAGVLAATLSGQLEEARAELAVEEERLFEQTLAGSVRRALADRIRQANALVDGINAQLASVVTAAGSVQVRLRWEVDPDQLDAVKAARSLLLRDPADLSDAERASLQDFVRARVDQARVELEANAPWEARLRETLDYRTWHRFSLLLGHRDWEGFQPATARRLQKLSTGERSIALHLPMIASVAAHYAADDGTPSGCPRLILLDELFAGVDTANRAQLFGTFREWDLDAVFTSDHEWCQYATLDGIAIHHLHPPAGDDPVTSTRFTWDGLSRQIDPPAA